jgi:tetratricopeptide (TPR) repeat protein
MAFSYKAPPFKARRRVGVMIEETLRGIVRDRIVSILEKRIGREEAAEIEKKMTHEDRGKILKEFEKKGSISEETYIYILSKYYFKDLTSLLFGIPSDLKVYPQITDSMIGSGKFGIRGLRKHVRELGYTDEKFEEILEAIYAEAKRKSRENGNYELFATACLEIGSYYIENDYKKAEKFLYEVYELRGILDEKRAKKLLNSIANLGLLYCKLRRFDMAKVAYEKARNMVEELGVEDSTFKELEKMLRSF